MSSPRQYFDEFVARRSTKDMDDLPVWRGDLQHHSPGCYSAHSGIKIWQRRAQAALLSAERWAVIVTMRDGLEYPREDLERAWKQVLFNQFHDILPGSAVEPSYEDARDQLGEAVAISKRIITRAQNMIARQVGIPLETGTQPVLVFNSHPWPVTSQIELQYGSLPAGVHVVDAQGRQTPSQPIQSTAMTNDRSRGAIAFQAEVPAFGYRLYSLRSGTDSEGAAWSGKPADELSASETVLENVFIRVEIDRSTGWLKSLLDKRTGVDLVAGATGDHTQICVDPTDTWGHRVVSYNWPGDVMRTDRIVLRERGPLRARLRVERSWGASTMVEEFILGHCSDQLEVRVTIDWRERAHLLKLRFPVMLDEPSGTYEIPYGALERAVDGAEEPGQSWVDVTGDVPGAVSRRAGLAVINNAKHGYDVSPVQMCDGEQVSASIGITAVRSPVYSWHDPRRLDSEGFYDFQDQGIQRFSYLVVPHGEDWRDAGLARRAVELGAPQRAMLESFHDGELPPELSLASDGGGQVMVTAIKGSEDIFHDGTDLIVRAVETIGKAAQVRIDLPLVDRVIEDTFGPSQVRTYRVPRDVNDRVVEVDLIEWPIGEGSEEGGADA